MERTESNGKGDEMDYRMSIDEAVESRHAVRRYTEEPISAEERAALEKAVAAANADGALHLRLAYDDPEVFSSTLARRAGWVEAIEAAGSSVRDLRRNLEAEGLDNVGVTGGDVAREAPDESPDLVVVDPPRAGLAGDVVRALSGCGARRICYVSCDPATLARDLARFEAAGPWRPVSVQPVDQFAQTYHVETVTLLEPRG